jgi:hypothetical protein
MIVDDEKRDSTYRETAGIITATICVISFIGIGFVQVAVFVVTGVAVTFPSDWQAAMLSVSSAALGFLVGSQSDIKTPKITRRIGSITTAAVIPTIVTPAVEDGEARDDNK